MIVFQEVETSLDSDFFSHIYCGFWVTISLQIRFNWVDQKAEVDEIVSVAEIVAVIEAEIGEDLGQEIADGENGLVSNRDLI